MCKINTNELRIQQHGGTEFQVVLCKKEIGEWGGDFRVCIHDLEEPVYIKDEGAFFTVWEKQGRVDIPVRYLMRFIKFLQANHIEYESEYDN